ncbi:uncharacterized protein LOC125665213 isoform X2 [Ostrea edulis]|uniref:uncharacterized protein LOC125665213 isoform X2 n=1 Tax=Ostrea edulis TaxID=37623 RepID=UPI0024AF214F|nr:uncharacterized protein LOC125665213 isoform X2 [Ostrea edulis]XP_056008117.1 uncharacterized protein LOC125665213 isoform X2 [Ostrea edulis]XP_056008118.1 uncharacterized protein LOC125665213 isoform X2 [Ostrea edulis]
MTVLVWFVLCWSLCNGRWSIYVSPSSIMGEKNVTFQCSMYDFSSIRDDVEEHINIKIRQNKSTEWEDIVIANKTGSYWASTDTKKYGYSIYFQRCTVGSSWYFYVRCHLVVSITLDRCTPDPDLYSVFRCQISKSTFTSVSPERNILFTKGQPPTHMHVPAILRGQTKSQNRNGEAFSVGDVIQIQCIGEIESINALPSQDIRWCKKDSGKFKPMSLQDQPLTSLVSRSEDGCVLTQESKIFYHIERNDTDLEIMCESGYKTYRKECGIEGANATLYINTDMATGANKWKDPSLFLYGDDGSIDPQNINIYETGRTIHLLCMASMLESEQRETINWCVKKQESANWTKIAVQEDEIKAIANETSEMIKFSRITYHVTVYDNVVHFLCELSTSSICGSGSRFKSVLAHMNGDQVSQQATLADEVSCSTSGVAVLSVLLCIIMIVVVVLVITTCRRGQLILFVFVLIDTTQNWQRTSTKFPVLQPVVQYPKENDHMN